MNNTSTDTARYRAAMIVVSNWRIRKRLSRITALAIRLGFIAEGTKK